MSNTEKVQKMYQLFMEGNIPEILNYLDDNIEWEYISNENIPWLKKRQGKNDVINFFESLLALEFNKFLPKVFFEKENLVVVLLDIEAKIKKNSVVLEEIDEVHLWYFNDDGKVLKFAHRVDTLKHYNALNS